MKIYDYSVIIYRKNIENYKKTYFYGSQADWIGRSFYLYSKLKFVLMRWRNEHPSIEDVRKNLLLCKKNEN